MGIYSKELRVRAVDAVERRIPRKDVVKTFCISLTTLKRWLRKRKEGEDLSPGTSTGRKRRIPSLTPRRGGRCGSSSKPMTRPP
jgi:transposase